MAGLGTGQLVWGLLSDRFGRRPIVLGGMCLYVVAALVCGMTRSFEALLAWRFVQGAGTCRSGDRPRRPGCWCRPRWTSSSPRAPLRHGPPYATATAAIAAKHPRSRTSFRRSRTPDAWSSGRASRTRRALTGGAAARRRDRRRRATRSSLRRTPPATCTARSARAGSLPSTRRPRRTRRPRSRCRRSGGRNRTRVRIRDGARASRSRVHAGLDLAGVGRRQESKSGMGSHVPVAAPHAAFLAVRAPGRTRRSSCMRRPRPATHRSRRPRGTCRERRLPVRRPTPAVTGGVRPATLRGHRRARPASFPTRPVGARVGQGGHVPAPQAPASHAAAAKATRRGGEGVSARSGTSPRLLHGGSEEASFDVSSASHCEALEPDPAALANEGSPLPRKRTVLPREENLERSRFAAVVTA